MNKRKKMVSISATSVYSRMNVDKKYPKSYSKTREKIYSRAKFHPNRFSGLDEKS